MNDTTSMTEQAAELGAGQTTTRGPRQWRNSNIVLVAGITFQEALRNRILLSILFFAAAVFGLNFILSDSFNFELSKVAVDISMAAISVCSLLIIFILCINQLGRDIDRRIVFLFLARPLARREYILGKFLGFAALLLVTELILGAGGALSVWVIAILRPAYVVTHFGWGMFTLALLFHFVSCLMLLACAMLFAVLSTSTLLAVLFTMGAYIAGQYLERVIILLLTTRGGEDTPTVQFLQWVAWIIPNLAAFDLKQHAAYGLSLSPFLGCCTLLYGLTYTALVLLLTTVIFSRKELS